MAWAPAYRTDSWHYYAGDGEPLCGVRGHALRWPEGPLPRTVPSEVKCEACDDALHGRT